LEVYLKNIAIKIKNKNQSKKMSSSLSYYFNEEHESFRQTIRQFLQAEAIPNIDQWEADGKIPREFWKKFGEMGYFGLCYPEEYGGSNLDFFYNVVMCEEISKVFSGGFTITAAVQAFMSTPYIMKHGSDYLKENYLKPAIAGEKLVALALPNLVLAATQQTYKHVQKKKAIIIS
jgi:acyl-CoA dehydrogenase